MENNSASHKKLFRKIYYLRSLLLAALKGKYFQGWYDSHSGCEDLNARFMLEYTDCKSRLDLQFRGNTRQIYFPFWKTSQAETLVVGLWLTVEEAREGRGCLAGSATFAHPILCKLSWSQKQRLQCGQQPAGPNAFLLQKQASRHADRGNIYIKVTFCIHRHFWAKFCPVSNRVAIRQK